MYANYSPNGDDVELKKLNFNIILMTSVRCLFEKINVYIFVELAFVFVIRLL